MGIAFDAFVGVDGCKAGWLAVNLAGGMLRHLVTRRIDDIAAAFPGALILVDVPIGLRDGGRSERLCDPAARTVLGPRRSSVFPAPVRSALDAPDYRSACEVNFAATGVRKLSKQSWAILGKIREIDAYVRSHRGRGPVIREMHPEICFWGLNGRRPLGHNKKSAEGYAERLALLLRYVPNTPDFIAQVMRFPPIRCCPRRCRRRRRGSRDRLRGV